MNRRLVKIILVLVIAIGLAYPVRWVYQRLHAAQEAFIYLATPVGVIRAPDGTERVVTRADVLRVMADQALPSVSAVK